MGDVGMTQSSKAREDWRRVNSHIHQEEQKLKELQLDYSEKVAVVEALKMELRQTRHETQECEQKEIKFAQAAIAANRKLQELKEEWSALQLDRAVLMQQLSAEQEGLKTDKAKIEAAEAMFEQELAEQRAYMQQLQEVVDVKQTTDNPGMVADTSALSDQEAGHVADPSADGMDFTAADGMVEDGPAVTADGTQHVDSGMPV